MKKIICKVEYDTETAKLVKKVTHGNFGDADGYEISLYQTEGGKFFFYSFGGPESAYAEETIKRVSVDNANKWLKENA